MRVFKLAMASWADSENRPETVPDGSDVVADGKQLIDHIHDFFVRNQIDVTADNLLVVHAALSGSSPRLARKFDAMREQGRPTDQAWLDQITAGDRDAQFRENLHHMLDRLYNRLEVFSSTAARARSDSGSYHAALEQVVSVLPKGEGDNLVSSLAELTRAMAQRTQLLEESMRRSEEDAKILRKCLDRAERDASIDHLTGLPNRRAFETVTDREFGAARMLGEPLCLAFCDIDHFKRINDTYGHDTGDRVIKSVADVFRQIAGEKCHVARYGGEEFTILFPGKNVDQAETVLDAMREALNGEGLFGRRDEPSVDHVSFSAGLVNVLAYDSVQQALEAADEALYRAKRGGRNTICIG